jgi:adenylate cyclase class 2
MIEREIKLCYDSPAAARQAVIEAGATPLRERRLQNDCLLDRKTEPLGDNHCTLRVRFDGDCSRVTFKGAPAPGSMKVREEIETTVGDGKLLLQLLERIGFRVWFRYQKYREEFRRGDLVIAVDESPIGTFVELEGDEEDILAMATTLERPVSDFVLDSYRALFLKHRRAQGATATHMLFDAP